MFLKILGSGTCVPSLQRHAPANYIKIGKTQLLVDCGSGTLLQLEKAGLDYKEIDIVCITHYHMDHISDLGSLLQALRWTPDFTRKKELTIIGPIGFISFFETYIKPLAVRTSPPYLLTIKEVDGTLHFADFSITSCKTLHTDSSIAYKFIQRKKSLVISGDTDYDEQLIAFAKKADVLVIECSFPNNKKITGHLVSKECGTTAQKAEVKKLILTHLYPISKETRLQETKKIFRNTVLAKDLMRILI